MKALTLYTNVGCLACHLAKAFFKRHKINFVERNLGEDPRASDQLINLGFRAIPVVCIGNKTLAGFSASKLRRMLDL
jgi:glutaredoxin